MSIEYHLRQNWPRPTAPKPVCIVGAGGIVRDAHIPAYQKSDLPVSGIFDIEEKQAISVAEEFSIPKVYPTLDAAISDMGKACIYDLAVPPDAILQILDNLPDHANVLIQKPMGSNLDQAGKIAGVCRAKKLNSAVNFQLRFSPMMLAVADLISQGYLGELLEIDVQVNIFTPWHLFPFLKSMDRVEISVHSIHYLDMIRAMAGNPAQVFARTMGDPRSREYAQTRTSAILDYGSDLRVMMNINHNHRGGNKFQTAKFRLEGTEGSAFVKLGVLYDYPHGEPDELWFCPNDGEWQSLSLEGTWFPDAFAAKMHNVQRYACGEDSELISNTDDALQTMALVEACYEADTLQGVRPRYE